MHLDFVKSIPDQLSSIPFLESAHQINTQTPRAPSSFQLINNAGLGSIVNGVHLATTTPDDDDHSGIPAWMWVVGGLLSFVATKLISLAVVVVAGKKISAKITPALIQRAEKTSRGRVPTKDNIKDFIKTAKRYEFVGRFAGWMRDKEARKQAKSYAADQYAKIGSFILKNPGTQYPITATLAFEKALLNYKKARNVFGEALVMKNLAECYIADGKNAEASELQVSALQLITEFVKKGTMGGIRIETRGGKPLPPKVITLRYLADLHTFALEHKKLTEDERHSHITESVNLLIESAFLSTDIDNSIQLVLRASKIAEGSNADHLQKRINLAKAYFSWRKGDIDLALNHIPGSAQEARMSMISSHTDILVRPLVELAENLAEVVRTELSGPTTREAFERYWVAAKALAIITQDLPLDSRVEGLLPEESVGQSLPRTIHDMRMATTDPQLKSAAPPIDNIVLPRETGPATVRDMSPAIGEAGRTEPVDPHGETVPAMRDFAEEAASTSVALPAILEGDRATIEVAGEAPAKEPVAIVEVAGPKKIEPTPPKKATGLHISENGSVRRFLTAVRTANSEQARNLAMRQLALEIERLTSIRRDDALAILKGNRSDPNLTVRNAMLGAGIRSTEVVTYMADMRDDAPSRPSNRKDRPLRELGKKK
ncbi:hypothetical protein KKA47_01305 [bacterium]|nr:hypothetical protein [bacterium]